jgi:hypothetical protein
MATTETEMAIRIPDTTVAKSTTDLLGAILQIILPSDSRAKFYVPAGEGHIMLQRVRVKLSRKRMAMQQAGKKIRHFHLSSSIHVETHNGKRLDCVILWRRVVPLHLMAQDFEDIMIHD